VCVARIGHVFIIGNIIPAFGGGGCDIGEHFACLAETGRELSKALYARVAFFLVEPVSYNGYNDVLLP
jgi:hypothetical protein